MPSWVAQRVNVNLIQAAMLHTVKIYSFNTCSVGFLLIYYEILECQSDAGAQKRENEIIVDMNMAKKGSEKRKVTKRKEDKFIRKPSTSL